MGNVAHLQADVLVIGGGATGAGVAWDAALRGFDVVLVERGDLAEGTSGRFHGLLHSGGRYAVKDPVAAEECVAENAILRRVIPDCIEDTGGLFVTTPDDDPAYGDRFLEGCKATELPVAEIPVGEALRMEPRLNPGIQRAFTVPDASIDAWKTVWSFARGAAEHGARVLPYHRVTDLHRTGDAVTGARVRNEQTGEDLDIAAGFVLNASGAWAAQIVHMAGIHDVGVIPGKGIMIAMNHRLVNTVINRCTMPADGDILVPIRTVSVIGTTDIRAADPDEIPVTQEEVDQMLDDGERLVPGFREARALRVWAGVRPLFQDAKAEQVKDTRDVSRTHAVVDHKTRDGVTGLLTMSGGKLTTLRLMAQDIVDAMCDQLGDRRTCRHGRGAAARRGRRGDVHDRLAARAARGHPPGRAADLRVRAGRALAARVGDAPARHAQPRRHPARDAARHGPVPGRLLHLPRDGDPPCGRPARRRGGGRVADPLPRGALEGRVADPLRRPAAPGAARRLDLPGPARRRAPPGRRGGEGQGRGGRPGVSHHDVVVVGAGLAGLSAAVRLAESGARVLVLAKGVGATHLAGATIDVLGYAPDRVERPLDALGGLPAGHPYHHVGADGIRAAVAWFKDRIANGSLPGYAYTGEPDENLLLPSAVGVPRPSAVVPETMAGGDLRGGGPVLVAGFRTMKDFHPALAADTLRRAGVEARSVELELTPGGRADVNALAMARGLDDAAFRGTLIAQLNGRRLRSGERVALPAVLGIADPHRVWTELERALGRPVFEIPTLPPSVPGMRVFAILREALRRAGGTIILNNVVVGAEREGDKVSAVRVRVGLREERRGADWVVLATGGFASGGVELASDWTAREVALGLPVAGVPEAGEPRFGPEYFGAHALARAGVAVDGELRPVDGAGERLLGNVLVAGATLAGAEPWKEKSGDGISLATGHRAAELVLAAGTATAAPAAATGG